jgi:hypothetical protein
MPDLMGPGGLNLLRLAQIFGQLGGGDSSLPTDLGHGGSNPMIMSAAPNVNTQAANVPPEPNPMEALMRYQPERQASDMFMKHIQEMPQRQQYPPSGLRQVGSVIAGLGAGVRPLGIAGGSPIGFQGSPKEAMEVSNAYRDLPLNRARSDWEVVNKPLEMAATNEKNYNLGQRQLLLGESSRMIQQQRADTYADRVRQIEQENLSKDEKRKADAKRDQDRVQIYRDISKGGTLQFGDDGRAYMVYKDGTKKEIDASLVSPEDMENLREKNREKLEGVREKGRETLEGVRQPNRVTLKKTPSGGAVKPVKPETGNEEARRRTNNAIQFKAQHPELAKHITIGSNGKVDIKDPGTRNGPSDYEYSMIYNSIFRSRESQQDVNLPKEKPRVQEEEEEPQEEERVTVTLRDMKTGKVLNPVSIPKSNIRKLDPSKYQVVK